MINAAMKLVLVGSLASALWSCSGGEGDAQAEGDGSTETSPARADQSQAPVASERPAGPASWSEKA